jgi:vancomycin permeability regulator SanA
MIRMYGPLKNIFLAPLFLLIVVLFFSCAYSNQSAQKLLDQSSNKVYDILVVPGMPFENGKWGRIMRGRVYWAKFLYDKGIVKNIMFSGSSVYSPYYEGKIMAMYAEAIGVPKENIFYETKAEHSTENIYYSYHLAKKMGFQTIALASDPFQTRTLRGFSHRRLSSDIAMIPMLIDTMKILEPIMTDPPIPSQEAFNENFVSLKKREGFFKRLKGTLGRNIKKADEDESK